MIRISIALTTLISTSVAAAAPHERPEDVPANGVKSPKTDPKIAAQDAVANGALSAFSVSPAMPHAAAAVSFAGYDGAARGFRARGAADGRLLGFLAARVEYEHGPANGSNDRVSLGLRGSVLNQAQHGIDLGAMVLYQPRDFRGEGNVVGGLLLARHFDRLTFVLNPLVGSDPEGDDQSFDLRFAGLYKTYSWLVLGVDGHGRYNLSSDQKRAGNWGIDWEAQAGASAAFCQGPVLLTLLVGPSFLQRTYQGLAGLAGERELRSGLLAMAGAGGTF